MRLKAAVRVWMLSAKALERPLLLTTILVTFFVAGGFIFGFPCSVSSWWCGVVAAAASCFWRKTRQEGARTICLFVAFLGLFWICANVTVTLGWEDTLRYHQPAVRMLIAGWNPLRSVTPDEISTVAGVPSDWMNVYHVVAMPRGVWYFCAAAFSFTHAPFNLLFPLVPFLLVCLMMTLWQACRPLGAGAAVLAVALSAVLVGSHDSAVDCVVAISAIGLLVTMYDAVRTGRWNALRLIGYSFWMAVSKQPALLQCVIFWGLFLVCILFVRRGHVRRLLLCGFAVFGLFFVTSLSPYGTSWMRFGHPLYPKYAGERSDWPTQDITHDFFDRNSSAAMMSHGWAYVNAFVSSHLCRAYYEGRTGKGCFVPWSRVWSQQCNDTVSGTPTTVFFRFFFCLTVLGLLGLRGISGCFLAGCLITGTLAAPTEMVGYLRYVPWVQCAFVFLLFPMARLKREIRHLAVWIFGICIAPVVLARGVMDLAISLDAANAIRESLRTDPPSAIIGAYEPLEGVFARGDRSVCANALMLQRQVRELGATRFIMDPSDLSVDPVACPRYYDNSFRVLPDYDLGRFSEFVRLQKIAEKRNRLQSYPLFLLRTYFHILPYSIWRSIHE